MINKFNYNISVAHVNHGLRENESDTDEYFIKKICEHHKLPFYSNNIKESLDEAKNYKGTKKEKMLKAAKVEFISYSDKAVTSDTISEGELAKLSKNTPGTAVINALRSESLNKGLSVFKLLGFIAIACGLLLFVIGKPIKKWMHGIN